MSRFVWRAAVFTSLFLGSALAQPAKAAPFDGNWSVLIVTNQGECDRGYRYGVRVGDGKINYDGTADISLSGTVSPSGGVSATVRKGAQSATATGKISASAGSGTWKGRGSAGECSGTWEAERR